MTQTNLFNAVRNELLPIVFDINNKCEFSAIASVDFSKNSAVVSIYEKARESYTKLENIIYVRLEETGDEIVVNKKFSHVCPKDINTYADLVAALKKYLENSHLNIK